MKTGFFEETPGQRSWIRLAGTYLLLIAGFIIINNTIKGTSIPMDIVVFLVSIAIGGKLVQKPMEKTGEITKPVDNVNTESNKQVL